MVTTLLRTARNPVRSTRRAAGTLLLACLCGLAGSCSKEPTSAPPTAPQERALDENGFWDLIGTLNWRAEGEDEEVCEPLVEALAARSEADIQAFEEFLAQKLHALDTETHARQIGEAAYTGADEDDFSADTFLYARCYAVAKGRRTYESVLRVPRQMPKDSEFEALLQLAAEAFLRKTGREFEFTPSVSYETFANEGGWKN